MSIDCGVGCGDLIRREYVTNYDEAVEIEEVAFCLGHCDWVLLLLLLFIGG